MQTANHNPVHLAIVGIGCLFPKADGLGAYWANIKHGVDCIGEVPATHWNPRDYFDADPKSPDMTYAQRGGFLSTIEFNPIEFGLPPKDIEATDTTQLLGLVAAKQALSDAGITFDATKSRITRDKVSIILGVTGTLELVIPLGARLGHPHWRRALKDAGVPDDVAQDVVDRISESYVPWQENSFPGLLGNVVAGRIANKLDLHGTNCVVDAACASSLSAVHMAAMELASGKADAVVTGGADTFNDIFMFMCFSKTPALSKSGDSKPFDANGDGTILGEGLGMVVLKRLADAERDGDTIYAVIRGLGTSSDGKGNAIYAPSAEGQKRCLNDAYRTAGVTPDTIELVEAHGTGTKVGDATEASALTEVYGQAQRERPWCAIGSVKSQIGHTKAAAGAASLIKAALALHFKVLPPTLKVSHPVDPLAAANSPFYVNTKMRPWLARAEHPRRAAVSAFGFGGSNFHAVLEEHTPTKTAVDWDGRVELYAICGETRPDILASLDRVPTVWTAFAIAAAESRTSFRNSAACRLILVAHRDQTDLAKLVESAKRELDANTLSEWWSTAEGAYYGRGSVPGKLGILFPGQGSQTVGMLRELSCLFPELLDTLDAANRARLAYDPSSGRISDRIYPPTSFTPGASEKQDAALRSTDVAQPAIGAVSFGAWRVLHERFNLTADAFAGHSFGELTALTAAGRLTPTELAQLAQLRGQLMAQQRAGDAGAMVAVFAPAHEIEPYLDEQSSRVVIANRNSPKQTVLSGSTADIEAIIPVLSAKKLRSARLPVAAAFHSPLVADAAKPFREALNAIPFPAGKFTVLANTTGNEYPADATATRNLLGEQLAKVVDFVAQIQTMARLGVRTFAEVGPGTVLSKLASQILEQTRSEVSVQAEFDCFALDGSGGKRSGVLDLAHFLARVAIHGYAVNLTAWEFQSRNRPKLSTAKPGLTIPLNGANYTQPRPKRPARSTPYPATVHAGTPTMNTTPGDSSHLNSVLTTTQQTLAALQRMQEETARLHKQFLESQAMAQQTLAALVAQQHAALVGGASLPRTATPAPAAAMVPVPVPTPQPTPVPASVPAPILPPTPTPPQAPAIAHTPPPASVPPASVPPASVPPASVPTIAATPLPVPTIAPPPTKERNGIHHVPAAPTLTPQPLPTGKSSLATTLLGVVSEKTGYPTEMLSLDMTLDGDLGIDSIKRVEILSAWQEKLPGSAAVKPEQLGQLHTLRDVVTLLTGTTHESIIPTMRFEASKTKLLAPIEPQAKYEVDVPVGIPLETQFPTLPPRAPKFDVADTLLKVVSEKTGYPTEMLSLDMTLDGDLGIDSIKRVEILSALQEKLPGSAAVKPEQLGQLHTLRDVVTLLQDSGKGTEGPTGASSPQPSPTILKPRPVDFVPTSTSRVPIEAPAVREPLSTLNPKATDLVTKAGTLSVSDLVMPPSEQAVSTLTEPFKSVRPGMDSITDSAAMVPVSISTNGRGTDGPRTGGPAEVIERSILQVVDLDTLGRSPVALPEGGEIWLIGEDEPLAHSLKKQFSDLGYQTHLYGWSNLSAPRSGNTLAGLILLPPQKTPPTLAVNRLAMQWVQLAGPRLRNTVRPPAAAVIASITRLDGTFGLTNIHPTTDPVPGGIAGIIKTVRWEWPELAAKAIDIQPTFADSQAGPGAIVEEILAAGPIEVGISSTHRCRLEIARASRRSQTGSPMFVANDVVIVTGGARGVTAEVSVALAEAYRCTLILTGRTPVPTGPEPAYLTA